MTYPEFESYCCEATNYLKARIEHAKAEFGIGAYPRYEYDLYRGEIWWSDVGDPKVRARVTIVGSLSTKSNTWLWSWGNPHFDEVLLGDIELVREFGEAESVTKLTEPKWDADEIDGWQMTSVAARLLEAQGAYRAPSKTGFLFMLYDHLEMIPDSDREHYMPLKRTAKPTRSPKQRSWLSRFIQRVRQAIHNRRAK